MHKIFTEDSWNDYLYWQKNDRKLLSRISALILDIERSPYSGIGKPERLKYDMAGCCSRRIDAKNRLVYRVKNDNLYIYSCKDHYK